jgi:hypothetical protein
VITPPKSLPFYGRLFLFENRNIWWQEGYFGESKCAFYPKKRVFGEENCLNEEFKSGQKTFKNLSLFANQSAILGS